MTQLTQMPVGEKLTEIVLNPVSRMDLIKYSGASGDFNPIHTIDEEATNAGLPGVIAHGMWTMGNLAKLFTPYYEEGFIQDYSIQFKSMVFLNDVITLRAVLQEREGHVLNFDVEAVNQHGKPVLAGKVSYHVF